MLRRRIQHSYFLGPSSRGPRDAVAAAKRIEAVAPLIRDRPTRTVTGPRVWPSRITSLLRWRPGHKGAKHRHVEKPPRTRLCSLPIVFSAGHFPRDGKFDGLTVHNNVDSRGER